MQGMKEIENSQEKFQGELSLENLQLFSGQ
jgi:hypothetical protein